MPRLLRRTLGDGVDTGGAPEPKGDLLPLGEEDPKNALWDRGERGGDCM